MFTDIQTAHVKPVSDLVRASKNEGWPVDEILRRVQYATTRPVPPLPIPTRARRSIAGAFVDNDHPQQAAIVFACDPDTRWILNIHWLGWTNSRLGYLIGSELLEGLESYGLAAGFEMMNVDVPRCDPHISDTADFLQDHGYECAEPAFLRPANEAHLPIPWVRDLPSRPYDDIGDYRRWGARGVVAGDPRMLA